MDGSSWMDDPWRAESYEMDDPVPPYWLMDQPPSPDRTVAYVVLVDGRVIDTWQESLHDSPWRHDPRVERSHRPWREEPKPVPEPRPWVETVRWLEHVVGGSDVLASLAADPLPDEEFELPELAFGDGDVVARFRRTVAHLDGIADTFFDVELRTAFRRALSAAGPHLFRNGSSIDPAQTAAAISWTLIRANGLKPPIGPLTQKELTARLGLSGFPSSRAHAVNRLLGVPQPAWVRRPAGALDLEVLARTDLLTSRTKREICSLRDRAREAEAQVVARESTQPTDLELDLRHVS